MSESIAEKIDELLADDRNLDTRAGLRLMTELVKDAFKYIEKEKKHQEDTDALQGSLITRVANVENGLNEFLKLRAKEQEHNEVERQKWRWAILAPSVALLIGEIFRWITSKP